ncbi:Protein Kinase, partial [Phytophthora palmivora]
MGRNLKGKAAKAGAASQQKRRKKAGLSAGGSSPALSASSSSGGTSTPGHRECEQCGNNMLLEGVAKAWPVGKKSVASTGCQICDFVAFRRSQRPCVQCARTGCDHFCEWCGKGFHVKCAKLRNEDVGNPNGFCCHKCEAEQSEGHDTDDEETKGEESEEEDVGSRCGSCRLPFATTGKDLEDAKIATGFKVNQAVLVDNDEVLYNALITEVDTKDERIKIHFTRWSKSFDDWYAMDDEHINESLACDCCNNWFHIGCLPPIKSSGRWKDSTYVCPRCIDDARAFHNGNRSVLKAKVAYISTSNAIAKAAKKVTSPKESETVTVAVAKTKKPSKAVVVIDDDDEDMEEKKAENDDEEMKEEGEEDVKITKVSSQRKRKLSDLSDSPVKAQFKENANERPPKGAVNDSSALKSDSAHASSPSKIAAAHSMPNAAESSNDRAAEVNSTVKARALKTPTINANAAVSSNAAMMHASPEHTVKVAIEAHSSPSKAAAAKIGASNKPAVGETKAEKQDNKRVLTAETTAADHSNRHSSNNTVMSLLNSPPANETSVKTFKPAVTSLPMLNPAGNRNNTTAASSKPSMAMSTNFQVYVKMEQKNGRFPLYPRQIPNKSAQSVRKDVSAPPSKPVKAPAVRKTKQTQGGAGGRGLSAFDILREVASQEIDEGGAPAKSKREKRPPASRGNSNSTKRAKLETSISNTAAPPGVPGNSAAPDSNQSPQTRERIQMNSFVDLHFSIRKEMYLRFCRLEEEGMLTRDSAHLLRSLIYPTSERFQDLKFVYLVNKELPSVQLTKRLLEAVPYPPAVAKPIATTVPHAPPAAIRTTTPAFEETKTVSSPQVEVFVVEELKGSPASRTVLTDLVSRSPLDERDPPKLIYIDVVVRFVKLIHRKPLLTRLASSETTLFKLHDLHEKLDDVAGGVGLNGDDKTLDKRDQWADERREQYDKLKQEVSNASDRILINEFHGEQKLHVALMALASGMKWKNLSPDMLALKRETLDRVIKILPGLTTADWFIPMDDLEYENKIIGTEIGTYSGSVFRKQLEFWSTLDDKHILKLFGGSYVDASTFYVCEYAEGGNLRDFFGKKNSRSQFNILVGADNIVKLSDFGFQSELLEKEVHG